MKPSLMRDALESVRPRQWTKNAVVAAAFFFALGDHEQTGGLQVATAAARAAAATALFCALSSGIYLINDIFDRASDALHPEKRDRPIAAGRLPVAGAALAAAALLAAALAGSFALAQPFFAAAAAYVALQLLYSAGLKRVALLDVMIISVGFVLRALAGALALPVRVSPWLLLCAFLLALFLALCKRRHEKAALGETPAVQRPALDHYSVSLLDQLSGIAAAATIVCYSIYTLSPETTARFHTPALAVTIPFVVYGLFRYLDLVQRQGLGGSPERILLTDRALLLDLAAYGTTLLVIFGWCR